MSVHTINSLRKGVAKFKGTIMPTCFEEYQEEIEKMEVRNDDIWVTSFPKSGTTWTQEMVYLIAKDLDYEGAKETLDKRFPHLEVSILFDFRAYKREHLDFECEDYLFNSVEKLNKQKGGRLIKTHLPWDLLPSQIRDRSKKPKIIHVFRNPKDVVVSYYHHTRLLHHGVRGDLPGYCETFLAGGTTFAPYWNNVLSFWNRRHLDNVLFITYEEMKRNMPAVITKVSTFLGKKPPRDDEMKRLVEHLSFASMTRNPAVAKNELLEKIYRCLDIEKDSGLRFIRSGKVGGHKEELSEEIIRKFDEWIEDHLKGSDFKLKDDL